MPALQEHCLPVFNSCPDVPTFFGTVLLFTWESSLNLWSLAVHSVLYMQPTHASKHCQRQSTHRQLGDLFYTGRVWNQKTDLFTGQVNLKVGSVRSGQETHLIGSGWVLSEPKHGILYTLSFKCCMRSYKRIMQIYTRTNHLMTRANQLIIYSRVLGRVHTN